MMHPAAPASALAQGAAVLSGCGQLGAATLSAVTVKNSGTRLYLSCLQPGYLEKELGSY